MQLNVELHEDMHYYCNFTKSEATCVCAFCTEYYYTPAYELATKVMRSINPLRLEPHQQYYITFDISEAKYFGNHVQCCNQYCNNNELGEISILAPSMFLPPPARWHGFCQTCKQNMQILPQLEAEGCSECDFKWPDIVPELMNAF